MIKLVESHGICHSGKVTLGSPVDLNTTFGGYVNRQLTIFFNVQNYAVYNIKITYTQQKKDVLNDPNQIKINESPSGTSIPDFLASTELNTSLISNGVVRVSGGGNHFIQNGNLGIGTITPNAKLDVNGTIHSKEVKVDMNGWPDYVFKKEYALPTLEEVEKHIKEKGHLENIPSEKEVLLNGISLGEMNIKLLQKIEELTLYMIEMKKENQKMKQDILKLEQNK